MMWWFVRLGCFVNYVQMNCHLVPKTLSNVSHNPVWLKKFPASECSSCINMIRIIILNINSEGGTFLKFAFYYYIQPQFIFFEFTIFLTHFRQIHGECLPVQGDRLCLKRVGNRALPLSAHSPLFHPPDTISLQVAGHTLPVDDGPERLNVRVPPVQEVHVVRVLPHVAGEEGSLPVGGHRVTRGKHKMVPNEKQNWEGRKLRNHVFSLLVVCLQNLSIEILP